MKVFISWSGDISRQIAEALRDWLPMAIQAVKPYMSQRDNEAGVRWEEVVSAELNASDFGIICLTPNNLKSTWLNFEAGALGKAVERARVVPLLYKLTFADVERPLGMFMAKPLDEQGVKETLETMNKHLDAERHMDQAALDGAFTALWPVFKEKLARVEEHDPSGERKPRDIREIAEEILGTVRGLSRPVTVWETAGGQTRVEFVTDNEDSTMSPSGAISRRLRELLGPDIECYTFPDHVVVRGTPSKRYLGPGAQVKYDRLRNKLARQGKELKFTKGLSVIFDNPLEETESH
jgi:hypothetical protein